MPMYHVLINAGALCALAVTGVIVVIFILPPCTALLLVSLLLVLGTVLFLIRGDIVFADPELSLWCKTSFCGLLFGSALAVAYLGFHQLPRIAIQAKTDSAPEGGPQLRAAGPVGSAQAASLAVAASSPCQEVVNPPASEAKPSINRSETSAPTSPVGAPPEAITVTGIVLGHFGETDKPLSSASIRAGQSEALTGSEGRFTLRFSKKQRDDLIVKISHVDCLPKFRRLDELRVENPTTLEPKLRVAVLDFTFPEGSGMASLEKALRKAIEKELVNTGHIKVTLHDDDRTKVLRLLHKQYQERGIYDKDTLNRMGRMCAASQGIFGSIFPEGPYYRITCTLANFTSGTTEKEQVVRVKDEVGWSEFAGSVLGLQMLAQLSYVRILTPVENSSNGRVIKAEGFAVLRPPEWSLWLTLVPNGSSLHFPQQRITVESDESWKSSDVHLGTELPALEPLTFTLYALLADPGYSQTISNYLSTKTDNGLDINAWDKSRYCIGHSIELSRVDNYPAN